MSESQKIQPVILCGGVGTRLWPMSRAGFPKQFLPMDGEKSLFQQALLRLNALEIDQMETVAPLVITSEEHRFFASEQLNEVDLKMCAAILEPEPRNTAPALTMAALASTANGDDPILVVTPADQTVENVEKFQDAVVSAVNLAIDGSIVVLGVTPNRPETAYGYVRASKIRGLHSHEVEEFVEKPDVTKAQAYLDDGGYYWNAGIFVLRASIWFEALMKFRPDIYETTKDCWSDVIEDESLDTLFLRPNCAKFSLIPAVSIDYAVMERCPGTEIPIQVIELDAGWNDLGSWNAVLEASPKDDHGNLISGDVVNFNVTGSLVRATSRMVAVVGVTDIVVVETADAVLVAEKNSSQRTKDIITSMQNEHRKEHLFHRKVYRPWGWYDVIDEGKGFKVKHIKVKPGARLSLQKHRYRAEHWVVVRGVAEVTNGKDILVLNENQSTYIPLGTIHRLANPGMEALEIIEVQSGGYLGEDDIVRFDDVYGRIH